VPNGLKLPVLAALAVNISRNAIAVVAEDFTRSPI